MHGILLIDKPAGWTSFDVVNKVRFLVAEAEGKKPKHTKVGHTGTLDPLATGLLVLLVGKDYTRRAAELVKQDKTYEVEMYLGEVSTTGDAEGERTAVSHTAPERATIEAALQRFTGEIMQIPPAFSAMKINGQRAYQLARAGKPVELEARPVTIHQIELTSYAHPRATFTADVSSGTYIRSLVTDLGEALQTGAYMSGLRRTRIGGWYVDAALTMEGLTAELIAVHLIT